MKTEKQVDRHHYSLNTYYDLPRWCSLWHQMHEVSALEPATVLEVGGGAGMFKKAMTGLGIPVKVVDIAEDLEPDFLGSIEEIPVSDRSFDISCAFQVLEHLPFESFPKGLRELKRVSKNHVVLSLPDAKPVFAYRIQLPKIGYKQFLIPRPFPNYDKVFFCEEHEWEVGRPGFELNRICTCFPEAGLRLIRTFRVFDYPYHRFFVADHQ